MNHEAILLRIHERCSRDEPCGECFGSGREMNRAGVGRILREVREEAGVSRRGVAERMEIAESYVGHMETGERDVTFGMAIRFLDAVKAERLR